MVLEEGAGPVLAARLEQRALGVEDCSLPFLDARTCVGRYARRRVRVVTRRVRDLSFELDKIHVDRLGRRGAKSRQAPRRHRRRRVRPERAPDAGRGEIRAAPRAAVSPRRVPYPQPANSGSASGAGLAAICDARRRRCARRVRGSISASVRCRSKRRAACAPWTSARRCAWPRRPNSPSSERSTVDAALGRSSGAGRLCSATNRPAISRVPSTSGLRGPMTARAMAWAIACCACRERCGCTPDHPRTRPGRPACRATASRKRGRRAQSVQLGLLSRQPASVRPVPFSWPSLSPLVAQDYSERPFCTRSAAIIQHPPHRCQCARAARGLTRTLPHQPHWMLRASLSSEEVAVAAPRSVTRGTVRDRTDFVPELLNRGQHGWPTSDASLPRAWCGLVAAAGPGAFDGEIRFHRRLTVLADARPGLAALGNVVVGRARTARHAARGRRHPGPQ